MANYLSREPYIGSNLKVSIRKDKKIKGQFRNLKLVAATRERTCSYDRTSRDAIRITSKALMIEDNKRR